MIANKHGFFIAFAFIGALSVTVGQSNRLCKWNEYHDDNVDDCGPCREICDHMTTTRTEKQCRDQCKDYLQFLSCTYLQYFDDVTSSCAPCVEICDQPNVTRTEAECSSQCSAYLDSKKCSTEQYFDETNKKCASCKDLCNGQNATRESCDLRCDHYKQLNPPVYYGDGTHGGAVPAPKSPAPEPLSPGLITAIVVSFIVALACIAILAFIYVKKNEGKNCLKRKTAYDPVDRAAADDADDIGGVHQRNNYIVTTASSRRPGEREVRIEMGPSLLKTSIQEGQLYQSARVVTLNRSEEVGDSASSAHSTSALAPASTFALAAAASASLLASSSSLALSSALSSAADSWGPAMCVAEIPQAEYGIPESDPLAPSSAGAFVQSRCSHRRSLEEERVQFGGGFPR